jgi:hypothetical protein
VSQKDLCRKIQVGCATLFNRHFRLWYCITIFVGRTTTRNSLHLRILAEAGNLNRGSEVPRIRSMNSDTPWCHRSSDHHDLQSAAALLLVDLLARADIPTAAMINQALRNRYIDEAQLVALLQTLFPSDHSIEVGPNI